MDVSRALSQIADIHEQMAKGEVYRGYRSLPLAASGVIGILAAWFEPRTAGNPQAIDFVRYWSLVGGIAGLVGASEIVYNYVVHEDAAARRRTRQVVGQFLPSVGCGAAITASVAHLGAPVVSVLPGLWAICFGLGTFASRPYLPKATGWVASFYCAAGAMLLWTAREVASTGGTIGGWAVGGTFGVGQLMAALVLYWNLERSQ